MSICKVCNGKGMVDDPMWADEKHEWQYCVARMKKCPACGGSGEVEQTNEEYIRQCNTEQLAEFVIKAMLFYDNAGITMLEAIKNAVEDNENLSKYFIENVVEWLKQPHNS